ncbi:hypothetical protein [Bosea sp. (in: a-proteobacteria)]
MLSISNHLAMILTGLALCGCMQRLPTAESLTRPTTEAFARLGSWTPWGAKPEPAPPPIVAEIPPPEPEALAAVQLPEPAAPAARRSRERHRPESATRLATAKRVPVAPIRAAPPAEEPPALLPARMSCQTTAQPGERVRMECRPAD